MKADFDVLRGLIKFYGFRFWYGGFQFPYMKRVLYGTEQYRVIDRKLIWLVAPYRKCYIQLGGCFDAPVIQTLVWLCPFKCRTRQNLHVRECRWWKRILVNCLQRTLEVFTHSIIVYMFAYVSLRIISSCSIFEHPALTNIIYYDIVLQLRHKLVIIGTVN